MNNLSTKQSRTVIRIGRQSLMFGKGITEAASADDIHIEPYTVKSGMSMAANLREAFRESNLLSKRDSRALVTINSKVLLVPMEEYDEESEQALYHYTFPDSKQEAVIHYVLPELNCVAVFSINKDVRMVLTDHFEDVRIVPLMVPVWIHSLHRTYAGHSKKMYAYFHDKQLDVFVFGKNRFKFMNNFNATDAADSTYFILYVWQTLVMSHKKDELYIFGDITDIDALRAELKKYIVNVFSINPAGEFNRAPATNIPNLPYDTICLCE